MKKTLKVLALMAVMAVPWAAGAQCTDGTPCQFTIAGDDSYGDGWEGNLIIYRNNVQLSTFTVASSTNTETFTVCAGDLVRIDWSGQDQYYENTFTITGGDGTVYITNGEGHNYAPSGTVVEFAACPSCVPPTNISASGITSSGLTINWMDTSNTGATYSIDYWKQGGDTNTVTTNDTSYTFSGLDANTLYYFAVKAVCSATDESTSLTGSFKTDCLNGSCTFTVYRTDSYDDSWNGCLINIMQGGDLMASIDCPSGQSGTTASYTVCSGDTVTLTFTRGSYPGELGGYIMDGGGTTVFTITSMGNYQTGDVLATIADPCPSCLPPTAITVVPDSNQIGLSWTPQSGASQFIVYLGDSVVDNNVTETFYTFLNLPANTPYTVGVQSICSSDDSSSVATVSTRTTCGQMPIPYTEDFEDVPYNGAWPSCWNLILNYNTDPSVNYNENHTAGGQYSMYMMAYNTYNMFASSAIPLTGNNIYVRYWARLVYGQYITAGVMTNPADTSTFIPLVTGTSTTWTEYEFNTANLDPNATYYAAWKGYGTSAWSALGMVDDIYISEIPSCVRVTVVNLDSAMTDGLTISWEDNVNSGAGYTVTCWADGTTDTMTIQATDTTVTITGLYPSTAYKVFVTANCSGGDAESSPVYTFRTACGDITLPFFDNFDSYDNGFWPPCWHRLRAYGTDPSVNAQYHHSGSQSMFLLSVNDTTLFCTPSAIPTTGDNIYVRYWAYLTYSSSYNETKWIKAGVMTDTSDMSTFIALDSVGYHNFNNVFEEREFNTSTLSSSATYFVAWMFYSTNNGYGSYNRGGIDDVYISEIPSCLRVSDLAIAATDSTSITVTWIDDANSNATYTVMVGDSVAATGVTDTFYTITGLNANTAYTISVSVDCGSDTAEAQTVSGRTDCGVTQIPYVEGFESHPTGSTPYCWTNLGGTVYTRSSSTHTGSNRLDFRGSTNNMIVLPMFTQELNTLQVTFWTRPEGNTYSYCGNFAVGYVTNTADASTFVALETYAYDDWTASTYEEKTVMLNTAPNGARLAFRQYNCSSSYYWYLDDITVEPLPDCVPVSLLTVDTTFADGATIHWSAPDGANSFIVRLSDSVYYNTTDTFYTFSGLNARSPYNVSVATDCSGDTADWVSTSFVTGCANGECEITVAMTDQYGDGWNGNAVEVYQNNALVGSATLTGGNSGTATISVCANMPVEFRFLQGSYSYEVGFTIFDGGDEAIYTAAEGSMSSTATGTVLDTVANACPSCLKPANLVATLIDSNDLAFSWTVDPAVVEYLVSFNGGAWQSNTIGTYNATGLNPNTAYTFSVKAHCSAYDTSNARTITVKTSCGQMVLPYAESFEGDAQGNVPSCWTVVRPGYNNYPAVSGSEHTGNNGMTLAAAYNDSTTIATSLVPLAGDSIHVSFWASVNAGNTLQAGVMTDLAYDSTFMPLLTIPSNGSTYTLYEFNTTSLGTAYSYTNFYVAFRLVTGSSNYYADVDDINISLDEGCMHPTNLTATTTSSSINLTWSANGVSMGTYVVQNKISGTNDWDTAGVTNDTTFNVTGLNPATSYVLRVGLICGSDTLWVSVSAVTDCAILPLPYSENFDAYAENVLPPCWTYDASGVTHYDGGLFFRSYSAGGDGAYAVVPELNGNFNKLQIEFDTKVGTIAEQDGILIGTADAAGTLIGWLDTIQDANHSRNAFVHHTINMLNYVIPYGSARLVFAQYRNWNEWALIDNLNIIELPDCLPVDSIAIFNVEDPDHTSFTWVNMGYETQWQVYVDTVTANIDSIPDSLFTTVNTMSYTIPMGTIQGGGIYTFYVRADCELEQSNWVSYTFGAGSVVMNNSSVADTVVGCGLVVYDNGGPIAGYLPNSNSALVIRSENAGSELEVFGGAFGFGSSSATLTIYDGEGTNGTVLYTYSVIDGRDTIDSVLATSTTGALTITFTSSGQMCHTGYELYIHCVGTAVCPRPTQVQGEMTGVGEATLRWVGNSASYDVYYKLSGASVWSTQNTTADSLNLTGLVPDTVYDFYVVGICGSETSTPSFVVQLNTTFEVVIEPCDPATDLSYSNVTTTEATLDWVSNGSEWQVEVKHLNVTDTLTVNTKPYTLTNLLPTMQYNVRVRTVCSGLYVEPYSDWSNTVTFTTMTPGPGPGSIDNAEDGMLAIYPNPASTVVNISVAMDGMVNLSLVDMNGRTVYSQNGNEGQFSIDVSTLAKGAYFVRVVGEQATSVRKLIVR